ncbi:hypothetical protein SK128_025179 [Halocaridina rubra]|uniref:MAM domain-containing protein n=1 Tax=Halocaridina rubra TaxID=373956 RepID=A0AAN8WZB5_HALRR
MSELFAPIMEGERCLTFWYHFYGMEGTTLSAIMQDVDYASLTVLWKMAPTTPLWNSGWQYASTPFASFKKHQLIIEAVLGEGFMGDIAVDDVLVAAGGCAIQPSEARGGVNYTMPSLPTTEPGTTSPPSIYNCDFSVDLCVWTSISGDGTGNQMVWEIHAADNSSNGAYTYLNIGGEDLHLGSRGILNSTAISATTASCLTFFYQLDGTHEINIFIEQGRSLIKVWHLSGPAGSVWIYGQVTLSSDDIFNILIEGARGDTANGAIAIDSIIITDGPCATSGHTCTFEDEGECGWHTEGTPGANDPRWHLEQALYTQVDHTTQTDSGHIYLAMNTWTSSTNTTALATSMVYKTQGSTCIRFFYYSKQGTNATLKMYYVELNVYPYMLDEKIEIWSERVGEISAWMEGSVELSIPLFWLQLEVIFDKADNTSGVAVDDISVRPGSCGARAECNFDDFNLCGWVRKPSQYANWAVSSGPDHTYAEDKGMIMNSKRRSVVHAGDKDAGFLVLETKDEVSGETAIIMSPLLSPAVAVSNCFQFWYSISDTDLAALDVYIMPVDGEAEKVWSVTNIAPLVWHVARVPLGGITQSHFHIAIEGLSIVYQDEGLKLDDFITFVGPCAIWPPEALPLNISGITTTTPVPSITTTQGIMHDSLFRN